MHLYLSTGAAFSFRHADNYAEGTGPRPAVLLLAGWKSDSFSSTYTELAKRLRALGYHTMQLSLRGHNGSRGVIERVTRPDHIHDVYEAVGELLRRPEVSKRELGIAASSYGAYIASCASQRFGIVRMSLRAPALYPDRGWGAPTAQLMAAADRLEWRTRLHTPTDSEALKELSKFRGDLLLISSEMDEDMPREVVESYKAAAGEARSKLHVELAGASHSLSGEHREKFLDITERWFKEHNPTPQTLAA